MRSEFDDQSSCSSSDGGSVPMTIAHPIEMSLSGEHVSEWSWTDDAGITGQYSGRVNEMMQPHGEGILIYKDGTAIKSVWENGTPMKSLTLVDNPKQHNIMPKKVHWNDKNMPSIRYDTYLPHLDLGDAAIANVMMKQSDPSKITSLEKHDFIFVKRSDQRWTYAIIADRDEDRMVLVVDTKGSTKVLKKKCWDNSIRLVNNNAFMRRKDVKVVEPSPTCVKDTLSIKDFPQPPFTPLKRRDKGWSRDSGVLSLFD